MMNLCNINFNILLFYEKDVNSCANYQNINIATIFCKLCKVSLCVQNGN